MSGHIKRRGPKRYLIRVTLGYDTDGKRIVHNETFHGTRKEAETRNDEIQRLKNRGQPVAEPDWTLDQVLGEWLDGPHRASVRRPTYDLDEGLLGRYVPKVLRDRFVAQLGPEDFRELLRELEEQGRAPDTRRLVHRLLKSALEWAANEKRVITDNPMKTVRAPAARRRRVNVAPDAIQRLVRELGKSERGLVFELRIETGLRESETLGLPWSAFDLDTTIGAVRVTRSIRWLTGGGFEFFETKTRGSVRRIPLSATLTQKLRELRTTQDARRQKYGEKYRNDLDLVFATNRGLPLHPGNLNKRWLQPAVQRAGIKEKITPRDMRHLCASTLLNRGVDLKVIQERLGHQSIRTTADIYAHLVEGRQAEATREIDAAIRGAPKVRASKQSSSKRTGGTITINRTASGLDMTTDALHARLHGRNERTPTP